MAPYHSLEVNDMNSRMKKRHSISFILTLIMALIMLLGMHTIAYAAEGTDGTEMQVLEAEQLEIQLGADWAGVEFELKTDAGMYPGTIPVGDDGVLRLEIGGSKSYILTCLNSSVTVPEPTQASATTEDQTEDGQTEMEPESQDAIAYAGQADPEASLEPDQEPETQEAAEENQTNTIAGIPVIHIVVLGVGMVIAIGCLITMHVLKKRRDDDYDDAVDADSEEDDLE